MTDHTFCSRHLVFTGVCLSLLVLPLMAGSASAQTPFACTSEALIVQEVPNAELIQVDQTVDPFAFMVLDTFPSTEINNLGFDRSSGILYAIELSVSGNNGIMSIDGAYTPTSLGQGTPALPTNQRFDAGDVSADGSTFYVNRSGAGLLYSVPLPSLNPITSVTISGSTGNVFDWAAHPSDGFLYGGDSTGGQLARVSPTTGTRTDFAVGGCMPISPTCTAAALPSGTAFGGAWFNAAERLFLYQNGGAIFEIDLAGPTIVSTQSGPGSSRNDGAACIQDVIGAAKTMSSSNPTGVPATVTIDYILENLSGTETLSNLSADDDLTASFGAHGTDWTFMSASSAPASLVNPAFNGHTVTELVNQAPTQSLASGASGTITVTLQLLTAAAADMSDMMCNQVQLEGETASGTVFGDLSTDDASTSDPNADGSPDERVPTCIMQTPVELLTFSVD